MTVVLTETSFFRKFYIWRASARSEIAYDRGTLTEPRFLCSSQR